VYRELVGQTLPCHFFFIDYKLILPLQGSSPAAYPHLSSNALEDLQYDMTTILHETLTHRLLHPPNLGILRGKKSWVLHLDAVVLYDEGNAYDALFMAARAALWDTKVPRTRSVEYQARKSGTTKGNGNESGEKGGGDMDVDEEVVSGFDTRQIQTATDFELPDYWDEGEPLGGRDNWPVCVTLNIVSLFPSLLSSPLFSF
jgi:exosome complex component RRP42